GRVRRYHCQDRSGAVGGHRADGRRSDHHRAGGQDHRGRGDSGLGTAASRRRAARRGSRAFVWEGHLVSAGLVAEAAGLFAVTNFDDIVVLSLFSFRAPGGPARAVESSLASTSPSPQSSPWPSPSASVPASCPKTPSPTLACSRSPWAFGTAGKRGKTASAATATKRHRSARAALPPSRSPRAPSPTPATNSASTCRSSPRLAPAARSCTRWSS